MKDRNRPCNETHGTLTCKLTGVHEMHEDPERGKWRHPKVPYGMRKKPRKAK